jgi:DNA helicase II / ATP-dependent DNA helicase PcrA
MPTRRALLRMMVAEGGRCISVGDENQACYGFTGADADAMDLVAQDWNAVRMPLSINYRCSKAVVRHAQTMVPEIEARDQAPEGSIKTAVTAVVTATTNTMAKRPRRSDASCGYRS